MTLQYHPVGKPVAKDPPHTLSWLLMATKPREPIVPRYVSASATRRNGVGNVRTARKRYLLRRWRDPANERGAVYVIPEADHPSYGRPPVLTKPVNFYCPPFSQSSQPAANGVALTTRLHRRLRPNTIPRLTRSPYEKRKKTDEEPRATPLFGAPASLLEKL